MTSTRLALSGGAELALDCELVRRRSRRQLARRGDARSLCGSPLRVYRCKGASRARPADRLGAALQGGGQAGSADDRSANLAAW